MPLPRERKTMPSPKCIDSLVSIMDSASDIERAMARLNRHLNNFGELLDQEPIEDTNILKSTLDTTEAKRLLHLNQHLVKLQNFLVSLADELKPALSRKELSPTDPMGDFEIEAQLHYCLRESDPDWSDDSDNFVTSREENLKMDFLQSRRDDYRENMPRMEAINSEPHCWLFHDLYDHSYGLDKPNVFLKDCLRLGEVWVDVVIRQQYWLNLDTGEWGQASK